MSGRRLSARRSGGADALSRYFTKHEYPAYSTRSQVLQEIARLKVEASLACDYAEAERLTRAEIDINNRYREERNNEFTSRAQKSLHSSSEELRGKKQQVKSYYKARMERVRQAGEEQKRALNARHIQEQNDFARHWRDPRTLSEFSKPSTHLINLRDTQQKMALLCDFQGAARLKKMADEVEIRETREAQLRAERSMRVLAEQLLKRQEDEVGYLERNIEMKVNALKTEKRSRMRPIKRALERALEEEAAPRGKAAALNKAQTARYREFLVEKGVDRDAGIGTYRRQHEMRLAPVRQLGLHEVDANEVFARKRRADSARRKKL